MPTTEENVIRFKRLIGATEAEGAPNAELTEETMKFLGVNYNAGATFHYAYLTGGVKYREPGKEAYWTDLDNFLKLREQGLIVQVDRHDNYDPVLGAGKSVVYAFIK